MSKFKNKIVSVATTLTVITMMVAPVAPAMAMTADELQAQITLLQEQLSALTTQLGALEGTTPTTPATTGAAPAACSGVTFTRNLALGSTGSDVKCLQALLNTDSATQVAASGVGSAGSETLYFGSLTKAAVVKFQNKYASEVLASWGLTQGTGFFGSTSRTKANAILAAEEPAAEEPAAEEPAAEEPAAEEPTAEEPTAEEPTTETPATTTPTVATGLTVSLASDTPAAVVLPDDSLYNSVLKLSFTASGGSATVTRVDLTRGGLVANTYITGISVWDENDNRLGNIVTALTVDNQALVDFGSDDLVVEDGQTRTVTVKINLGAATSGTVNFSLAAATDVDVEGTTAVNGTFPISGNTMSIADGANSLGNVYVSAQSVGGLTEANALLAASANISVGDTGIQIAKFRFSQNNSLEAIQIEKLVVYVEGTLNEDKDLTSWTLYDSTGAQLATAVKPVDRYLTFSFADPYVIAKGLTKDLTLKADIADGSTHYFRAQLQNDYDIMIKGVSTGSYIAPLDSGGTAWTAGTDGADANSWYRVKVGSLTVTKAADSPSGTVSPGDQDVVLAKFNLKAGGEDLEIRQMGIWIEAAATTTERKLTGSVRVLDADDGTAYVSISADDTGLQGGYTATYNHLDTQNLSTYLNIPSGTTKAIKVTASIQNNDTISTADNYQVSVGKFYAKRKASNDYATLPGTGATNYYESNQLDVASLALSITANSAFSGKRLAAGVSAVQIGEFVLGASAADDIRVSTMSVKVSTTTGIQNVYLLRENGTQVGSTVGTPNANGDTFTVSYTIPKSTTELLKVFADITTDAYANRASTTIEASTVSGYGVNSSKSLATTTPAADVDSNYVTLGTAALAISKSASAPVSQIFVAGQTGVTLDVIDFEATYETLTMKAINLELESASTSLWASGTEFAQNFSKIYLYDGSTLLNTGGTPVSTGVASITGINVTLPSDTIKKLTVKADLTGSGTLAPRSVGRIMVDATSTTALAVYSSTGLMSSGITLTDHARSNMFLFTDTAPTVVAASGWTGTKTGSPSILETIGKYTVTNPGTRTMTLKEIRLIAALSSAASYADYVQSLKLYDENDILVATSTIYVYAFGGAETTTTIAGATTTYVSFDIETYFQSNATSVQEISAGASKTYSIKADTSHVEDGDTGASKVTERLQTYMLGAKGYDSTDTAQSDAVGDPEYYWKAGYVFYKYTPSGGSELSNLDASDSGEVYGATLTY